MNNANIFGQWIGRFEGDSPMPGEPQRVTPGIATFNIERDKPDRAFACVDQGNAIHGSRKDFIIKIDGGRFTAQSTGTTAFDFDKNEVISIEESTTRQARSGKDVSYIADLHVEGTIDHRTLEGTLAAELAGRKITGRFSGKRLRQNQVSRADATMTWNDFKAFIADRIKSGDEFLFRGQSSNKFRLCTSFHREGRYDMFRYGNEDCAVLAQHINARSPRQYDLRNAVDFGALLSLAQHHGFPTPLLDWSWSPYVAAFFALKDRGNVTNADDCPRVYVLNEGAWRQDTVQAWNTGDPRPTISPREFPAHDNPRHLPQQSVHTYTNVEDPEAWIRLIESANNKKYLTIIDIPRTEREIAIRDLAYMNVTAASLFPGLDGICSYLKERFFRLPH